MPGFVVSVCNPAPQTSPNAPAAKATSNPVKHELEPLTKWFPPIGKPHLGHMDDRHRWRAVRQPGCGAGSLGLLDRSNHRARTNPSDTLRSKYAPTAADETPNLNDDLRAEVLAGTFLTSHAMDIAVSNND